MLSATPMCHGCIRTCTHIHILCQDLLLGSEGLLGEGDKDEDQPGKEEEKGDSDALLGSHGPKYGGGCELLYDQFELHSPVAKKHQIVLLEVSDIVTCTLYQMCYVSLLEIYMYIPQSLISMFLYCCMTKIATA